MGLLKTQGKQMVIKFFALLFFSVSINAFATPPVKTPESIPGVVKVTAEELIDLIGKTSSMVLVDARMDDSTEGFIEGSVNLSNIDTNCDSLSKILKNKTTPVMFYCNGVTCGRSAKSAKIALSCGYKSIYWYRGGFKDWKEKAYPFITK